MEQHDKLFKKMGKEINFKGLGIKQKDLLQAMSWHNLKIVLVKDAYECKMTAELRSNDDNDLLENLSLNFVDSLGKRQMFNIRHWMPSMRMEFTTLTLKSKVVDFFK